ncbi:unnamed protein product (macronuclear) [Paramecium tetraurelia]|uniref:Alpha/beta hydrolase fold-3 domain-containing protein n=1 Tax=Paramecium tetraurelia TaxID=5888 RepID=A0DAH7_PARTE|nr:uncharacterized protein GSPATT00014951001 [Paramecium tetraurelia]CAK80044.1 unnamed protein product [Paramecium tetraurelia]|eukprot:XP_001447441.1 hypothetical protein (macronuclear) [Paramecium tetraurelia strain d4-2]
MNEEELINITGIIEKTNNQNIIQTLNEFKNTIESLNTQDGNNKFVKKCLNIIYNDVLSKIDELSNMEESRGTSIKLAFELQKIKKVTEMLPYINKKPKNTIFNEEEYMNIPNIEIIKLDQSDKIKQQLNNFYQKISLGHAYVSSGKQHQCQAMQCVVKNLKALYYMSNQEEANLAATQVITNPTLEHVLQLWRIIDESKIVKAGFKLQLEKVKLKKIIYIPRLFNQITLDYLHNFNTCSTDIPNNLLYQLAFRSIRLKQNENDIRVRVMCNKQIFKHKINNQDILQVVRRLTNSEFQVQKTQHIQQLQQPLTFFGASCVASRTDIREMGLNKVSNIIIHIHGGGFISQSSFSHQSYTRKWANKLDNAAVFSIDYRLAPEFPFPQALDDCWQYYMWIVHFGSAYFNICPKNIILMGDSAGGNLALGIIIRAIEINQRIPDKIILQYPALNLNLQDVVPSNLKSMNDSIIPMGLLMLCRQSYIKDESVIANDYYLSPIQTPQKIIEQFPKDFVIFVGSEDVLLDNSVEFVHYCKNNGLESIKLKVFESLPHGFQNMDIKYNGVMAANSANTQILDQVKQFTI